MQKIRNFEESQAKIVLITSIPQDVFIASGETATRLRAEALAEFEQVIFN